MKESPDAKGLSRNLPHYYGDITRKLFLIAGLVMLGTMPFLRGRVSAPVFLSVIVILILTFAAGLTSPRQKWSTVGGILISLGGFAVFAFEAITKFERVFDLLFATNMALACLFLSALYLSVKTLRGFHAYIPKAQTEELKKDEELKDKITENPFPKIGENEEKNIQTKKDNFLTEEERRRKRFLSGEGESNI